MTNNITVMLSPFEGPYNNITTPEGKTFVAVKGYDADDVVTTILYNDSEVEAYSYLEPNEIPDFPYLNSPRLDLNCVSVKAQEDVDNYFVVSCDLL